MWSHAFKRCLKKSLDFRHIKIRHLDLCFLTGAFNLEYTLKTAHIAVIEYRTVAIGKHYKTLVAILAEKIGKGYLLTGDIHLSLSVEEIDSRRHHAHVDFRESGLYLIFPQMLRTYQTELS